MSGFEVFLLALYAVLMVIITVYSFHAYLMVYLYHRRGRNRRLETVRFEQWPTVTVQLPIYNEQYVVERLIAASCRLEYPRDRLEIQVLDDSTDETQAIARSLVDRYRSQGVNIVYLHRDDRTGFKAGALRAGLHCA
ncbi:glycosyltransferase, partial [bacterium]|nr:glycosyltransferase [bacterium]